MSAPTWTEEQRQAITSPMRSLLVSAAAGSGKTSVLADRCVWLVCDSPDPCEIDQLLVATFTRAAAAEMRDRINKKLRERASKSNDPRIEHQLRIADRATISTLDSFCAALVREHFVAANVDPNFVILDEDEARLLRLESAQITLDTFFKKEQTGELHQLLRIHFGSDESRLMASIIHVHNVLTSIVDSRKWLKDQIDKLEDEDAITKAIDAFYEPLKIELQYFSIEARRIGEMAQTDPHLTKHAALAFDLAIFAEELQQLIIKQKINQAIEFAAKPPTENFVGAGRKANAELKDEVMNRLKPLRTLVDEDGAIRNALSITPDDLRETVVETAPRIRLFIDLVREFERNYSAAKRAVRSLDFADVAHAALGLLQSKDDPAQPSPLARSLHGRFRHVLVDECQDNSPIQDAILRLVSTESISQIDPHCVSNLFSVGDVKQSIYEFRLANPSQFIARSEQLAAADPARGKLILLQQNFRSRGPLLDALNEIFSRLITRESAGIDYDQSQLLRPGHVYGNDPSGFAGIPVELHLIEADSKDKQKDEHDDIDDLDSSEAEAHLIANRIHQLMGWIGGQRAMVLDEMDSTRQSHRPIRLGDMAILLRSARGIAGALAGDLRQRGVPVHVENAAGFFDAVEVLDVLSLLQVADNATRDIALAALIRSPFSGISEPESFMARWRLKHPHVPFHQAVRRERDSLADLHYQIDKWRNTLRDERLDLAIERIVDESGYLNWLSGLVDGAQRIANVQELIRRARTFSNFERQGVSRFIQFLRELEDERDLDLPAAASQSRDVVRIMTVHKSKGLEFPVVFMPDLGRRRNRSSLISPVLIDRDAGIGIHAYEAHRHVKYPSLFHRLVKRAIDQREVAEELRILYVALTRAREHLILIGTGGKVDSWRKNWSEHSGPMPAQKIRTAQTMLERLGPVAAMIERDSPEKISIFPHSSSEIASLPPAPLGPDIAPSLERIARLEPSNSLQSTPSSPPSNWIDRHYEFEALTQIPSAQAVTQIKQQLRSDQPLRPTPPRFASKSSPLSAADRGIATHALLQHLDYQKLKSDTDIRLQIQQLVDRQLLLENQAGAIDIESLIWFGQTDLCRAMNQVGVKLLREIPIYMAQPCGPIQTPLDQLLLRGRIDLVMIDSNGAVVIDFKTDRLDQADIEPRVDRYRSQLAIYREAILRMIGTRTHAKLVFLGAKQVIDV